MPITQGQAIWHGLQLLEWQRNKLLIDIESDPKKTAQTFCIPESIKTKKQQI